MGTGARIKKRRQELHISQSKLASMAGMSQSGLSTIENEKNRAMSDNLSAIASALQCSVAYLLGETNDPKAISQSYSMAASLDASADVQNDPEDSWALRESLRRDPNRRILFDAASRVPEKDIMTAVRILEAFKEGKDSNE